MNREIKFRFWHLKDKKMIDWFWITQNAWNSFRGETPISLLYDFLTVKKDDVVIQQFTGLKDKNGVDIFEGDIVRILYSDWPSKSDLDERTLEKYLIDLSKLGKIVFEDNGWGVSLFSEKFDEWFLSSINHGKHGYIEIIGNIYENPELL